MAEGTVLKVNNVDVSYGNLQVLWDVSLDVSAGGMVAIIGSNGSGKSSLINAITGFNHPTKGSIEFEGMEISNLEPHQIVALGICQVPEGRRVFPTMTVADNIAIGAYTRKARAEMGNNLKRVHELFPLLQERREQLAETLSGGEQQMLAIARAIMGNPKLMILDELSLGLSPLIVNELFKALRVIKERGVSIMIVEQNVRRVLTEVDRAYILKKGRIVLSGYASQLQDIEEIKKAYFGHNG